MTRRLLLSVSPGEVWAALVVADELIGLRLLRSCVDARAGDIFLGRVIRMRPELSAMLIDIGAARPGFLSREDMLPAAQLHEGQSVIVQVTKEARAEKSAGLTMKFGGDELQRRSIQVVAEKSTAPALLEPRNTPIVAALKAFDEVPPDEIIVDDLSALAEVRAWLGGNHPDSRITLSLHRDKTSLFEVQGITSSIDAALAPRLSLAGGGSITIETTAAATVIDVDSGSGSALAVNLAAAATIARQIILRNLAGPIVIDFIGMKNRGERPRIEGALGQGLAGERATQLLGWTRLGHFEMVRKRNVTPLMELLFERSAIGFKKRPLTIALEALRILQRQSEQAPGKHYAMDVHREISAALELEAARPRRELESRLGYRIRITERQEKRDSFDIVPT
jgi:ribonuclease G